MKNIIIHISLSLFLMMVVSCGMSEKEKNEIAIITCNIIAESRNMDASLRIKEVNAAREKIGEEKFLETDEYIKTAYKYGLCKELVLNDLSLTVKEHTATVLIGASGSGKSTLLRCINLLETIDDGQIFLDGQEISDPLISVDEVRRKLGMVFQSFNLFPHKTVLENITLSPIKVHGVAPDKARDEAENYNATDRVKKGT